MLTLSATAAEVARHDDPLDVLEARLEDISARLDDIARRYEPLRRASEAPSASVQDPADAPAPDDAELLSPVDAGCSPAVPPSSRRRTKVVTGFLVVPMVVIGAVFAVCSLPALVGYRIVVVSGGSMAPTIPLGSVAFTRLQPPGEVAVGDVILVRRNHGRGAQYLHRVERVKREDARLTVQTRGDANDEVDADWIEVDRDVPTLAWSIPAIGYIMGALGTPLGWAALVLGPAALVCAAMIRSIWAAPLQRREVEPVLLGDGTLAA